MRVNLVVCVECHTHSTHKTQTQPFIHPQLSDAIKMSLTHFIIVCSVVNSIKGHFDYFSAVSMCLYAFMRTNQGYYSELELKV